MQANIHGGQRIECLQVHALILFSIGTTAWNYAQTGGSLNHRVSFIDLFTQYWQRHVGDSPPLLTVTGERLQALQVLHCRIGLILTGKSHERMTPMVRSRRQAAGFALGGWQGHIQGLRGGRTEGRSDLVAAQAPGEMADPQGLQ